jgi:hypothetical protein
VTNLDVKAGDRSHEWPRFLPGGKGRFLYSVDSSDPERAGTYIGSLRGESSRRILSAQHGIYSDGYLLFLQEHTLMAQRFDVTGESLEGGPVALAGDIMLPSTRNDATLSVAPGLLAYGGGTVGGQLRWLDRSGRQLEVLAITDRHSPALLSGQDQVLVDGNGVWLVDLHRGTSTRLIADGTYPIPSPDGERVVFSATRHGGRGDLFVTSIGRNRDELLLATAEHKLPNDWTRDGRYVVYATRNPATGWDLWLMPMDGDRTPVPFSTDPGNQFQAQVSPDGRWIAYASDESGAWQVHVQTFPRGGNKRVVSPNGGGKPQWRADGRELYYLAPDRMLMAVPVGVSGDLGIPRSLFVAPIVADLGTYRSQFVPTQAGQRFLFDASDAAAARQPITLLVNWIERLNQQ